jgi:hypothetical protein
MKVDIPRSVPMEKLHDFAESVNCKIVRTTEDGIALRPKSDKGHVIAMPPRLRGLPSPSNNGPTAA